MLSAPNSVYTLKKFFIRVTVEGQTLKPANCHENGAQILIWVRNIDVFLRLLVL